MLAILRICRKDLFELLSDPRGVLLVLVLPSLMLLLVGQLRSEDPTLRLLVTGTVDEANLEIHDELMALLGEMTIVEVNRQGGRLLDPLETMRAEDIDLVLDLAGETPRGWTFFTAETDPRRLSVLTELVKGLERALTVAASYEDGTIAPPGDESHEPGSIEPDDLDEDSEEARLDPAPEPLPDARGPTEGEENRSPPGSVKADATRFGWEIFALGVFEPTRLVSYYAHSADVGLSVILRAFALILCFLPFVLTAPTLFREREAHTLEPLLAAPGMGPAAIVCGKVLFAAVVTFFNFGLMLVLLQSVYSVYVKSGAVSMSLFLLPAIVTSALLGLTTSAMAKSQAQMVVASALYFLGLTLLTGFLYPLEESSRLIGLLSNLFPLTFVGRALGDWMLGVYDLNLNGPSLALWLQCFAFLALTLQTVRSSLRHL